MFKKIALVIFLLFLAPMSFAVNVKDLNIEFFNRFNDEYLIQYINEALENNHNAKQATARVEEYRQGVKIQFANELPTFGVSAGYLGINFPDINPAVSNINKNNFILPFVASYEADLLLKNRDKTKSAKKSYEMSRFDEQTAYLALLSDVATVYTNILEFDKLIDEQEKIVSNNGLILSDTNKKFARGITNTTELNNARNNVETSKIALEKLKKQREVILMEFAVLLGRSSDCTNEIKRGSINNFEYLNTIPNEIASDVIFSRPDVKRAETALEKAKIDIRVARKEFLPRFNITGIWAFNTLASGSFFSWESSLAALFAGATQDIFAGGRKVANLRFQKAKYEELFEQYKQVDLNAVKEVNTSLCIIKHDTEIENKTKVNVDLAQKDLQNTIKMLNRGVVSNTQYKISENQYLNNNMDLTKAKTQRIVNYYTLYKTVGGKI